MSKVFVIDVAKCSGCYNCQLACKDEHCENDWRPYARPPAPHGPVLVQGHRPPPGDDTQSKDTLYPYYLSSLQGRPLHRRRAAARCTAGRTAW